MAQSAKTGRETGNIAAKGTGYSSATLDKVTNTRELDEDESQPEAVRETAREALAEMDSTGKVDRA